MDLQSGKKRDIGFKVTEQMKKFGLDIINKKYENNIGYKAEYLTLIALISSLCILHKIDLNDLLYTIEKAYNSTKERMLN